MGNEWEETLKACLNSFGLGSLISEGHQALRPLKGPGVQKVVLSVGKIIQELDMFIFQGLILTMFENQFEESKPY
jgi:hypothetical protein